VSAVSWSTDRCDSAVPSLLSFEASAISNYKLRNWGGRARTMSVQCLASMTWRRALKHFPLAIKPIDINPILTAASLAPTSFGVQPFQIYVVTNADVKSKIAAVAYRQPQVKAKVIMKMSVNVQKMTRIMPLTIAQGN
jgi:Nitroreductase family